MNRKKFNEILDLVEDINSLIDKHGEIDKANPMYTSLKNMIFYNLFPEEARQAADEFVALKHSNYEDVGLDYKQMLDVLKKNKEFKIDPEEDFFAGLMDDNEYETYKGMKSNPALQSWNAKKFYELYSEMKDRSNKPERALLARLFKTMLEDDAPVKLEVRGHSFKNGKYKRG